MTPRVKGETLVYRQGEQEHTLTVGTTAWFAWLENASTFSFVSPLGHFTARHEQSGHQRGGWYWKAYRKQHGVLTLIRPIPCSRPSCILPVHAHSLYPALTSLSDSSREWQAH